MFTKNFTQLSKNDASIAGGKGASLGEMTQAGLPVPPGFVVLAGAFNRFLEETDLSIEIESIFSKINQHDIASIERASKKIQSLILDSQMPDDIKKEIEAEFEKLGAEFVAVRSSATAEDSSAASWAGELESYLNTTKDTLLESVKKCWASLFTPRAIFYRFEKEMHNEHVAVAVVVQKMVQSEVSGIAFTVHPVTEDYNQMVIEAGYGLGEAIVGGMITPDTYVINKKELLIEDKNISQQEMMIVRSLDGNEEKTVEFQKQELQKISDEKIIELSRICINIENHYKFPCDIEWACEDGILYIVQSRPITTLSSNNSQDRPENKKESDRTEFKKSYSRDTTLFMQGLWAKGLIDLAEKKFGWKNPQLPFIAHYVNDGVVEIWENKKAIAWFLDALLQENRQNPDLLKNLLDEYKVYLEKLKKLHDKKFLTNTDDINAYVDLVYNAAFLMTIFFYTGMDDRSPEQAKNISVRARKEGDFFAENDLFVRKNIAKLCNISEELAGVVLPNELGNIVNPEILTKRLNAFLLIDGNEKYSGELVEFEKNNPEFYFEDIEELKDINEFSGQVAFVGKVKGRVRIIKKQSHMVDFQEGNILVSPMTTPDFLPAMKKAAAFVTDEGGITCHAAIVAREMQKPCIIGTKIATQVLKNGDFVEVDADNGMIKISENKNNAPIILSKFYTRAYSLFYAWAWREANCKKNIDWLETNIGEVLFIRPDNSNNLEVWYSMAALNSFRKEIEAKYFSDSEWFDEVVVAFNEHWHQLFLYFSKKEALTLDELKDFYSHWIEWWTPMAIMMQIPEIETLPQTVREKAYQLRAETQEYSDMGDETYFSYLHENCPKMEKLKYVLTPEEVFSREFPTNDILEKRNSGWYMTNDRFGFLDEFEQILEEKNFTLEKFETEKNLLGVETNNAESDPSNKILVNIFSREKSLIYFCVWDESDRKGIEFIGDEIKNNLFIVPAEGNKGSVWYEKEELDYLKKKTIEKYSNDLLLDDLKKISEEAWNFVAPYAKQERVIESIDEFQAYYDNLVNFWICLNSFSYEVIENEVINSKVKKFLEDFRDKTEAYTETMSLVLTDFIEKQEELKDIKYFVTKDEVVDMLKNKADSSRVDSIKQRKNGCIMLNQKVYCIEKLEEVLKENGLVLERAINKSGQLNGSSAYPGIVKGVVIIVNGFDDLSRVKEGDVLITQMTNPKYLPAIKKASAIVTDEGGMLCHAAIVAREIKKPCIIGTKIATQVLKDGDIVEVDANTGTVKRLQKEESGKKIIEKFFNELGKDSVFPFRGPFSPLLCGLRWNYPDDKMNGCETHILGINKGRETMAGVNENKYFGCAIKVFHDYANKKLSIEYLDSMHREITDQIEKLHLDFARQEISKLSEKDLIQYSEKASDMFSILIARTVFIETFDKGTIIGALGNDVKSLIDKLWEKATHPYFESFSNRWLRKIIEVIKENGINNQTINLVRYIYTDYFCSKENDVILDDLNNINKDLPMKELEAKSALMSAQDSLHAYKEWLNELKEKERSIVSYIQFVMKLRDVRKDPIAKLQAIISQVANEMFNRAGIDQSGVYCLMPNELSYGIKWLIDNEKQIAARKNGLIFYLSPDGQRIIENVNFESAVSYIDHLFVSNNEGNESLNGQSACSGKVSGKVKIVLDVHSNHSFDDGDILVTSMTRPEFVPLMKKAAAIITNEGGVTCHAAIVSRELNIPCIIGTKNATQFLKDGDIVEVDADSGIVKILEK